jgi:murein DD-endopeptidase MepM/ murein hydrolase activator NlpD
MRVFLFLLLLGVVAGLALTRAEPFAPHVNLDSPVEFIGRSTALQVSASDRGTGLARVELRLVPPSGPAVLLAEEHWTPNSQGWWWEVHEATLTPTVDAGAARLPEGPATLEVVATDHSWLAPFRREARVTHPVTVDVTPPTVEVLTSQHVARLGGSECVVYRPGADAATSGVQVGREFFPGVPGLFADASLRVALFALPQDAPTADAMVLVADKAQNRRTATIGVVVRPRRFAEKTLPITDEFLSRKVPELLQANGLDPSGDLVSGYLRINRDLRATTEVRVREICRDSSPVPLWEGAFLRLPNSAPLSGFADRRSYVYNGKTIDNQTHLGFDLASLRGSPVPAANTGRVVFAGPLGIYGNTVIVDHGLGLFSLYGHLSEVGVTPGTRVARGDAVGKTGDTGLAAGDHLHFSMMVRGVHVDPVEWWDGHWIQDHVDARLAAYPRVAAGNGNGS